MLNLWAQAHGWTMDWKTMELLDSEGKPGGLVQKYYLTKTEFKVEVKIYQSLKHITINVEVRP